MNNLMKMRLTLKSLASLNAANQRQLTSFLSSNHRLIYSLSNHQTLLSKCISNMKLWNENSTRAYSTQDHGPNASASRNELDDENDDVDGWKNIKSTEYKTSMKEGRRFKRNTSKDNALFNDEFDMPKYRGSHGFDKRSQFDANSNREGFRDYIGTRRRSYDDYNKNNQVNFGGLKDRAFQENKGYAGRFDPKRKNSSYDRYDTQLPKPSKNARKVMQKYNLIGIGSPDAKPIEVDAKETDYHALSADGAHNVKFDKYNLPQQLLTSLEKNGYSQPFKIQVETLEHTLNGKDVFAKAFTGSGKTLAFAIPIITKLLELKNSALQKSRPGSPKCLVLSPTRELCQQLHGTITKLSPTLKSMAVYGGMPMLDQIQLLRSEIDIVCATPGRLQDLIGRKNMNINDLKIICLDEADALLKPGFNEQIRDIIKSVEEKQMLMFSATMSKEVEHLLYTYMKDPKIIDVTTKESLPLPTNINHYIIKSDSRQVVNSIKFLLDKFNPDKTIIFTNRKKETRFYESQLRRMGVRASSISSDNSQMQRTRILDAFKNGKTQILIATDVAARGLDVPDVNLVINVNPASNGIEAYIHRSGRTGRAGKVGTSVIIDCGLDQAGIDDCKHLIKFKQLELPMNMESRPYKN